MSKSIKSIKPTTTTKYCKVCHDAGKTEKEYTSHFVKSEPGPNGKVVCPILLSQNCGFCGNNGHTPKYCPVLAEEEKKKKTEMRMQKIKAEKSVAKSVPIKTKKTGFATAFDTDSDESDTERPAKVAPAPAPAPVKVAPAPSPAQLLKKEHEFPALKPAVSRPSATSSKSTGTKYLSATINKLYPNLQLAETTPVIEHTKEPMAKIVRKDDTITQAEFIQREPQKATIADFIAAKEAREAKYGNINTCDWAAADSDSDSDEDW